MLNRTDRSSDSRSVLLSAGMIFLLAAGLSIAVLFHGSVCGDDSQFHLFSWLDVQQNWKQGILYPHWAPSPNYGAGEPRFVFYPPLSWMLGAALGLVLPWRIVPAALITLLLGGIGLSTFTLARRLIPQGAAVLAGCLALGSTYSLYTAYERAGYGEITCAIWIPLLLLFALQDRSSNAIVWRRALDGSVAPLAITFAACWLSDIPGGIMASYLLAGTAMAFAILARSFFPLIRAGIAVATGFALTAFYLLPALLQQSWISPEKAVNGETDPELVIQNNWLFSRPPLAPTGSRFSLTTVISLSMIGLAFVGAGLLWRRARGENQLSPPDSSQRRFFVIFALISGAVLFLQLPISLPLWNLLPKLRFLQFPFRWNVVLVGPMAILVAAAVWPRSITRLRRIAAVAAGAALLAASIAYANTSFFWVCEAGGTLEELLSVYRAGTGFWGAVEYASPGSDDSTVPVSLPPVCFTSNASVDLDATHAPNMNPVWRTGDSACTRIGDFTLQQPEHLRISAVAPREGFAILRLRQYPAWRISVNGHSVTSFPARVDGLVAVHVPNGPVQIEAVWHNPPSATVGWLVSLSTLIACAAFAVWRRRSTETSQSG